MFNKIEMTKRKMKKALDKAGIAWDEEVAVRVEFVFPDRRVVCVSPRIQRVKGPGVTGYGGEMYQVLPLSSPEVRYEPRKKD